MIAFWPTDMSVGIVGWSWEEVKFNLNCIFEHHSHLDILLYVLEYATQHIHLHIVKPKIPHLLRLHLQ